MPGPFESLEPSHLGLGQCLSHRSPLSQWCRGPMHPLTAAAEIRESRSWGLVIVQGNSHRHSHTCKCNQTHTAGLDLPGAPA